MLHQIGNGALGPVFRAYDADRDRLVAIKVYRLDIPPERVHQLVAEFEQLIAAELQHPVIAAPRGTGITGNSAYLAQDFVPADSLDVVLRENGAMAADEALRVAMQLAEAFDTAADRHVLHGALHPRDILLSKDDLRVVGFGVGRALERVGVATPVRRPYSAPERINDEGWDRRADVFSLAAIVYELLSGKRVSGTGSEAADSLTDVAGCDVAALQRVFALALAADPDYRFATAAAFVDALKEAIGNQPAVAAAPRPKPRRARPKLRVVAQASEEELALPLHEHPDEVSGALEIPEIQEVLDVRAFPETDEDPEIDDLQAREPSRRHVAAPTPVAIETVQQSVEVTEVPELHEVHEHRLEIDLAPDAPDEPFIQLEPEPLPIVFAEAADAPAVEALPELHIASELEPEPEPVPEAVAAEPESVRAPASDQEPHFTTPVFLSPVTPAEHRAATAIWPIGVAAVLGIALGFGAGYTIAIRDRAVVPVATVPGVDSSSAPAAPAAASQGFTEARATPVPQAPVVVQNPVEQTPPPAVSFDGRVLVRSTPSGARVFVDGKDKGQTPAAVRELARGEHRIRVVRDGYTSAERRVVLSTSQPSQSLSIPLAREPRVRSKAAAPEKIETTTLSVESRPPGATVLVDGRPVGTTPLSLGAVRLGAHVIRLERDGYRAWSSSVTIEAGDQNRITASLEK